METVSTLNVNGTPYEIADKMMREFVAKIDEWNLNKNYPIGKLWWSKDPTNPHDIVGGVWEPVQDKFILAAGPKHPVGTTGGEEKHSLSIDEIPSHNHGSGNSNTMGNIGLTDGGGSTQGYTVGFGPISNRTNLDLRVSNAGGNLPHNNMPPYEAYYCWRRTA